MKYVNFIKEYVLFIHSLIQSWSSTLKIQLQQLKLLELDSHVQVYWIFWEIFSKKNLKHEWSVDSDLCCHFKFLEGTRIHWLFHVGLERLDF